MKSTYLLGLLTALLLLHRGTPNRNCSTSVDLCTAAESTNNCTVVADDIRNKSLKCSSISFLLEQHKSIVRGGDCLQVNLHPGTYSLSDYEVQLNYSVFLTAPEGDVSLSCENECLPRPVDPVTSGSPLWFQQSEQSTTTSDAGEFFVLLEGISFEHCQRPLLMDTMDYVGIYNCSFTGFESSAVDIFNCQNVEVENSSFSNCTAMQGKEQFHGNSGGLSIAYHTNSSTTFHDSSHPPWVHVTDCVFRDNKALLPGENTQQQINAALNDHFYYGRGGGLGFYLDELFINITLTVENTRFENNFAQSFGGALYVNLDGIATQHNFTFRDCNFTGNRVGGGFGGGIQLALLARNADSEPTWFDFIQCTFTRNSANFGGGLSAVQTYSQGSGNQVLLSDSYFEGNSASDVGSAVMFASLLYVQNRKASYFYRVSNNIFCNNTSPGGTFGAGFIHQDFSGHNLFLNNTGPGLRIVGSQVVVRGNLSFTDNNAENYLGGAVYISAFGQIKLYRGAEINFVGNIGRIGSAIVVDVQRSSEVFSKLVFNTQCFLLFENAADAPVEWTEVKVRFSGNRAAVGPAVYISHLNLCSWFSVASEASSNHIQSTFSTTNFTLWPVFDYSGATNMATSQPAGESADYYFQTQATNLSSSSISEKPMPVYPGQVLPLGLVGLDQFEHATYFIARMSDRRTDINSGAFSQATEEDSNATNSNEAVDFEPALIPVQPGNESVEVLYRVPVLAMSQLMEGELIRVVVDAPYNVRDISQRLEFSLSFKFCQAGYDLSSRFEGDDLLTCACLDDTFNILECDSSNDVIVLRDGLWGGSNDEADPQLEVYMCPIPYCQCVDRNSVTCDNLFYQEDPLARKQCHALRDGTLCGHCVNGTGVGTLRFNCRHCDTSHYWSIPFLVVWDVVVCVAILVAMVKLHITFPQSMKGFLFYIQTAYYTTAYFPVSFWDSRKYMLYLGSALGLYFPWDFCLFPGMSALVSFAPRLIPLSVATSVSIAALLAIFRCFKKSYIAQRRIWHGLWALVLLLYTPLVYTCIILLHCPSLPSAQGEASRPRWYLDGEVECFREGGHIALGLVAILLLSLLSLLPLVIFVFTLFARSPRIQAYRLAELLYLALSAGYQERARWWGAWDLARRLLLVGVIIACSGRSVVGLYIVIPALALHLFFLPYTRWWQNLLEALLLADYVLLLLLRSTQTILDDLSTYPGTTMPLSRGSGLVEPDSLSLLFSFWYYLPLAAAVITLVAIAAITLVIRVRSKRNRSRSAFEVLQQSSVSYTYYIPKNQNVTVTHVSL